MKELSIEEKAKRYDEAFEIARLALQERGNEPDGASILSELFPELKYSEGERIRKEIVDFICWSTDRGSITSEQREKSNSWLAWLEKQNSDISLFSSEQRKYMEKYISIDKITLIKLLAERDANNTEIIESIEKQGEQKPTDKVEPKFKIEKDKWYVCLRDLDDSYGTRAFHKGSTYYSTKDETLLPDNSNVPFEIKYCVNDYFRPWTIQDAKDGDVLANDNEIVIFKENNFNQKDLSGCMFVHCSLRDKKGYWYTIGGINPSNYIPATKEQRDTLMKAMAEAGYTFDFEKKGLKKIGRKSDWSEEDERRLNSIIKRTVAYGDSSVYGLIKDDIDWLKSLKGRVGCEAICTTTKEWSEDDERNASYICAALDCYYRLREERNNTNRQEDLDKARNWLYNKLKSIKPQNNSITDEELVQAKKDAYNNALDKIEYHSGEPTFDDGWGAAIWYLKKKNTMPQSHWKPSDEQITWLYRAADNASKDSRMKQVLNELLSDLKKLRDGKYA